MAIEHWDLRQVTQEDREDLAELTYTFKAAESLGQLTSLTSLARLNLGFNSLSSIRGIDSLQQLQHLDISHNQVTSLDGMASLTRLSSLLTGHNRISSMSPVGALQQLEILALHHNNISKPSALLQLSALASLAGLTLAHNPICVWRDWELATVAMLPRLQQLGTTILVSAVYWPLGLRKEAAALLPVISVGSLKPSTLVRKPVAVQRPSIYGYSNARPITHVHQQRYGAASCSSAAVVVRSDGSMSCTWPEGGLAVSLDPEEQGGRSIGYRLLAMYPTGSCVAVSFDSSGGFVQYPGGQLMLVWSRKDGGGTCYAADGTITHTFSSKKKALYLKQDLTVRLSEHFEMGLAAADLDLQLGFCCQECHITASLRDGPVLAERVGLLEAKAELGSSHGMNMTSPARGMPQGEEASAEAQTNATGVTAAAEGSRDDMQAILERARLLMMAASDADSPTSAAPDPGISQPSPAPPVDADDTKELLARARALMMTDYGHLSAGKA
eukprot:gene3626-3888_t